MCPDSMICTSFLDDLAEKTVTLPFRGPDEGSATVVLDSVGGAVRDEGEAGAECNSRRSDATSPR